MILLNLVAACFILHGWLILLTFSGAAEIHSVQHLSSRIPRNRNVNVLPDIERQALQSLYNATNGPFWTTANYIPWNFSLPNPCDPLWVALQCIVVNNTYHVSQLYPWSFNLTGTIPDNLDNLQYLDFLNLSENNLVGTIPESLGNLPILYNFNLAVNHLCGTIPDALGQLKHLSVLYLVGNDLQGSIPEALGNLHNLEDLNLSCNNITGKIPTSLGNLQKLRNLTLSLNLLTGSIPDALYALPLLKHVDFSINFLSGELSERIGLRSLKHFDVSFNNISGTIPSATMLLPHMEELLLNNNMLSGSIDSTCNNTLIRRLILASNRFTGSIPTTIGNLTHLKYLAINNNSLTGTLPSTMRYMSSLQILKLGNNFINGTLPGEFGEMRNITRIMIANNLLESTLPSSWGNMTHLLSLELSNNFIFGSVPDSFARLANMTQLLLNDNYIRGTVPTHIRNLQRLGLGDNYVAGNLTENLLRMPDLVELNLTYNYLTGTIPDYWSTFVNMQYLLLDNNSFHGTIPLSIAKLHNLTELALNSNNLVGSLDHVFSTAVHTKLSIILLNNNRLTGTLPDVLFQLPSLRDLVVGSNCFNTQIPESVCGSTELNSLVLDGMGTSVHCGNDKLPRYLIKSYIDLDAKSYTIPQCIYTLPQLNLLHISGNSYTGTLPTDVNISKTLLFLSASHNALSGHIPASFQDRPWKELDLSFNQIGGTLLPTFATDSVTDFTAALNNEVSQYIAYYADEFVSTTLVLVQYVLSHVFYEEAVPILVQEFLAQLKVFLKRYPPFNPSVNFNVPSSLNLVNNRISGDIPRTLVDRESISILGSNMFYCDYDKKQVPVHDNVSGYNCGSSSFNDYYYAWLGLTGVIVIVACVVVRYRERLDKYIGAYKPVELVLSWWGTFTGRTQYMEHAGQYKLDHVYAVNSLLLIVSKMTTFTTAFILFVLAPVYLILRYFYSTYVHAYAYTVSAAYLTGIVPTVVEIVLLIVSLLIMQVAVMSLNALEANLPKVRFDKIVARNILGVNETTYKCTKFWVTTVFVIVNVSIVVTINVYFVITSLKSSTAELTVAQVGLGVFKQVWNNMMAPKLLHTIHRAVSRLTNNKDEYVEARYITMLLCMAVLNTLFIPCIVLAVRSSSCFYNAFTGNSEIKPWYIREYCSIYNDKGSECILSGFYQQTASYTPSFAYSYQCTSSLLATYSPTFVTQCLTNTFATPLLHVFAVRWYKRASHNTSPLGVWWYTRLRKWIAAVLTMKGTESQEEVNSKNLDLSVKYTYFNICRLVVNVVTQLAVLLTFGALFPPLALALAVSILATIYHSKLVVGRFLYTMLQQKKFRFLYIVELECQDMGSIVILLRQSIWLLMFVKCLFYSFMIFDTLGDDVGFHKAFWVFIVVPLLPTLIVAYYFIYVRWSGESGAARTESDAARSRNFVNSVDRRGVEDALSVELAELPPHRESTFEVANPVHAV